MILDPNLFNLLGNFEFMFEVINYELFQVGKIGKNLILMY